MKHSIRGKILVWITCIMGAIMLIGGLAGTSLIENYYLNSKEHTLVYVYDELVTLIDHDGVLNDSENRLNDFCENKGVTLLVLNSDLTILYAYGPDDVLVQRMQQILFESIIKNPYIEEEIINDAEQYQIKMVTDRRGNDVDRHLEMSGNIGNSQYFVMRVAVQNIRESIALANKFYGAMGIILIIIAIISMYIITRMFTTPVLKLAEISKKMSNLNFDVHYDGKRDDEIGVLGDSINEMSEKLERTITELKQANVELQKDIKKKNEIDKMRTEFLSNVSHELKTPIALVQGYAEGLKDGITDDPESMEFYCDVIIDEANKMNKMVKNLLTLNQIEFGDGQTNMERFDITELVKGVLNSQSLKAKNEGVTLEFEGEDSVYVWADEFQIEEVITNYVSNALNHVTGNKRIKVQIMQKNGIVRVSVFNTGDPIPEEDIEHIWDKFYKVDKARTREYGGNGIGLSIVKAIIDRMGKGCGVNNLEDGVEFWFELDSNI